MPLDTSFTPPDEPSLPPLIIVQFIDGPMDGGDIYLPDRGDIITRLLYIYPPYGPRDRVISEQPVQEFREAGINPSIYRYSGSRVVKNGISIPQFVFEGVAKV